MPDEAAPDPGGRVEQVEEQTEAGTPGVPWSRADRFSAALCAQTDPDAFFPEFGENPRPAKRVCTRCAVRWDCLFEALMGRETFGVWGGLSALERRPLLNELPKPKEVSAEELVDAVSAMVERIRLEHTAEQGEAPGDAA